MRFDTKFARALERRYANKFINLSNNNCSKSLQVTFWFGHEGREFMFKYEFNSRLNNDGYFIVTGNLYLYNNNTRFNTPWDRIKEEQLTKKYNFDWKLKKIVLAKRCIEKDVRQTQKEIDKYELQVKRFWEVNTDSL